MEEKIISKTDSDTGKKFKTVQAKLGCRVVVGNRQEIQAEKGRRSRQKMKSSG